MKVVSLNENNPDHMEWLKEYQQKIGKQISYLSQIEKNKDNESSIEIEEVLLGIQNQQITHTCHYRGMKDNRLIEMEIDSLTLNTSFLEKATNYAFSSLRAESVTIFSNDIKESIWKKLGFESLGNCNGYQTYIKDRQKDLQIGTLKR